MTDVGTITSLLFDTLKLNNVDLVTARKTLLWMGVEFMRKEGFTREQIFNELRLMETAYRQLIGEENSPTF